MTITLPTPQSIDAYRAEHFRQSDHLRVTTVDQAEGFVADCGLVLSFAFPNVLLPSLANAMEGTPSPQTDWESLLRLGSTWTMEMARRRHVAVGKLIKRRVYLVSLDVLQALYTLAAADGRAADGSPDPAELSPEALQIFLDLKNAPPDDTGTGHSMHAIDLRNASGLDGHKNDRRYLRALAELHSAVYVLHSGLQTAHGVESHRTDLAVRMFPALLTVARQTTTADAARHLVQRYVTAVGLATEKQIRDALGLKQPQLTSALAELSSSNLLHHDRQTRTVWTTDL